jgi:hypothetical protein
MPQRSSNILAITPSVSDVVPCWDRIRVRDTQDNGELAEVKKRLHEGSFFEGYTLNQFGLLYRLNKKDQ